MNFRFQPKVCNGFHDMIQKSMSFNDVAIVTIGRNDYRIHFWGINKKVTNRMKNANVSEKSGQKMMIKKYSHLK